MPLYKSFIERQKALEVPGEIRCLHPQTLRGEKAGWGALDIFVREEQWENGSATNGTHLLRG